MNIRKIFVFLLFLAVFLSCNKNKHHPVPYYSFDVTINLTLPSYNNLQGVGGWAYVSGAGSKGIVVYRQSIQNFIAFDRHSPAEGSENCKDGLEVDSENFLILNDPCSNAKFSLYDGSVISGNSKWGLRSYLTEYNGGDLVRIYNP
ncbi:MAG: hypothetical protein H3C31_10580 [Brumimicrobium sp.]|nr:hypothetical protein [Brumimicrobium sp.]MCO5267582.1 hypothetical protein [Brumimicrobium sp.]